MAEFAYNNRKHSATKASPFYLEYGRHPRVPTSVERDGETPAADEMAAKLEETRAKALVALEEAAADMKRFEDVHQQASPVYKLNDQVFLDSKNLATGRPAKKLDNKSEGPFKVVEMVGAAAVRLKLPLSWKVYPVFHVSKVRPAIVDRNLHPEVTDDTYRLPPDVVDGEEQYEIEEILDHHGKGARRQYLVKWKGYPVSEATWEPRKELVKKGAEPVFQYELLHGK